jgi:putative molybdopterin biosynthesis protein
VAIEPAAREYGLAFLPLREERYDFVAPADRLDRPAVRAFRDVLGEAATKTALRGLGCRVE